VALTDRLSTEPARVAETRALIAGGAELLGIGAVEFVPPPQGGLFGRGGMGGDRLTVDLRGRGARFESVTLPRAVATADERWLVVAAPGPGVGAESRPIAAIAAYAGRRQRIVARLARGGAEPGILADLAAAAMPAVVVVVGMVPGWAGALAVATPDLIAAELVWLVLAEGIDQEDEPVGPWEDATVQRATELELGVRLPGQIDLRVGCPDQAGGGQAAALGRLGDRLRLQVGDSEPSLTWAG
jgi:hypothetical protein